MAFANLSLDAAPLDIAGRCALRMQVACRLGCPAFYCVPSRTYKAAMQTHESSRMGTPPRCRLRTEELCS